MKVIILEDEFISRQKIEEYVLRYNNETEIVLSTDTFDDLPKYLVNQNVDLILADIEVVDGNIFAKLSKQPIICPFIFITAYDNYTFEALENYGFGYLLKPYTYQQFSNVMDRFHSLNRKITPDLFHIIDSLKPQAYRERIIVKSSTGAKILKVATIKYAEIEQGIIFLLSDDNKKYMMRETTTLTSLENSLDPQIFFRINKSQIINLNAITNFESYGRDRIIIKLARINKPFITSINRTSSFKKWVNR